MSEKQIKRIARSAARIIADDDFKRGLKTDLTLIQRYEDELLRSGICRQVIESGCKPIYAPAKAAMLYITGSG